MASNLQSLTSRQWNTVCFLTFFLKGMEYSMVGGYIKEFDNLLEVLDFSQDWGTWIPSGMSQVLLLGQTPMADR